MGSMGDNWKIMRTSVQVKDGSWCGDAEGLGER